MRDLLKTIRKTTNKGLKVTFEKTEVMEGLIISIEKIENLKTVRRKSFIISDDQLDDYAGESTLCSGLDKEVNKLTVLHI
jgi:hypothetical protein